MSHCHPRAVNDLCKEINVKQQQSDPTSVILFHIRPKLVHPLKESNEGFSESTFLRTYSVNGAGASTVWIVLWSRSCGQKSKEQETELVLIPLDPAVSHRRPPAQPHLHPQVRPRVAMSTTPCNTSCIHDC